MKTAAKECSVCGFPVYDGNSRHEGCVTTEVREDASIGKLIDVVLRVKYGEDFQWDTFKVTKETDDVFIVEIDTIVMSN